jgi:hypothetical protein
MLPVYNVVSSPVLIANNIQFTKNKTIESCQLRYALYTVLAVSLYCFFTTSLPNGVNAKPASLKCCFANGIPIIVIPNKIPKIT